MQDHDLYLALGKRLRTRRRLIGLSQEALGARCGIRFQQVQKYESADNRMSAATLWRLSQALGVTPDYFFEGLRDESVASSTVRRALVLARP